MQRKFLVSTLVFLVGGTAFAQPRVLAKPLVRPAPAAPAPAPTPAPAPAAPAQNPNAARICEQRSIIVAQEQRRSESYQSDLVGIDAEISSLQRRLEDLKRQRDDAKRNADSADARYKRANDVYSRECKGNETCGSYDTAASDLDRQSDAIQQQLGDVRNEIRANRDAVSKLETRIAPLQKEYTDKKCNNLVPGETEQTVIDRCTAIFSDWNRLQGDLNRQNTRTPELKSRFEMLFADLKNMEKRASTYESYLAKNCTTSVQTAKMHDMGRRRQDAQTIGTELDGLINDITRLRGVKITISAQ